MRRHWATVLLFVLALVVQTLAPATGAVAVGKAVGMAAPGLSAAAPGICLTAGQTAGDQKQAPGKASHHRDLCPLCQSSCDGAAPLAGRIAFCWAAPVAPVTLAWSVGARGPPVPDFDYARQPRAPPAIS